MNIFKDSNKINLNDLKSQIAFGKSILNSPIGDLYFYHSKYEFKMAREINIPLREFKKIPDNIDNILILFKENLYIINKYNISKSIRILSGLAVYQIHKDIMQEIKPTESKSDFVHLHCHGDYSLLDGVNSCTTYLKKAKEFGMPAMAITDHGNVSAHMELQINSKELGIKPIFGIEHYLIGDILKHDGDHRTSNHLVLLAKNDVGYKNLLIMQKLSWSEDGFYYRPRVDYNMLKEHSKGVIALTACLKSPISSTLFSDGQTMAIKVIKKLYKIFGEDLYLEIQMHNIIEDEIDIQKKYNKFLLMASEKLGIKHVITNDVHYLEKGMHIVQEKVVKIKKESDITTAYCDSIWFKSQDELESTRKENCKYISKKQFSNSISSVKEIISKCNYEIPTGGLRIPSIDISEFPKYKKKMTEEEYLRKRIRIGLKTKLKSRLIPKEKLNEYKDRIEYEVDAFIKMDVISYILIYDDLIRHLKKKKCLSSLRGSANGSIVLFLMGLSIVDPIKFNILFERFISPARIQAKMADIDIDLDINHTFREYAIQYLKDKYGDDHICLVGSFQRNQLRAAIKNIARVEAAILKRKIDEATSEKERKKLEKKLEPFSFLEINKVTKLIMNDNYEEMFTSRASEWANANKEWLDKYIKPIIGTASSQSLHPAGVVISPEPYHYWLPVRSNKLSKEKGGNRIFATQWENSHTFEEYLNERDVMVMDILGVKTLTIISDIFNLVKERYGNKLKLEKIPLDDEKVYETISNGENLGTFQINKGFMKSVLRSIKPDRFEDLTFLVAADRPGPIASGAFEQYAKTKHEEIELEYPHPSLESVLEDSLGVLVYSEHIMKTATEFAGMDAIDSEKMRKIIKAKSPEDFIKFKERFIESAVKKWTKEN